MAERKIRLAVEGCVRYGSLVLKCPSNSQVQGHGTLHAIYASVAKSCEMNGWDGVDLVIVGGDFQVKQPFAVNFTTIQLILSGSPELL